MNNIESCIAKAKILASENSISPQALIACMDLTALNNHDSIESIDQLCSKALKYGVASVCVYPKFVAQVKARGCLDIATVANFPFGNDPLDKVVADMQAAVSLGATELDVVLPYQKILTTVSLDFVLHFVELCRQSVPQQKLKIILETGAFTDLGLLKKTAHLCLKGGADFLKTSTGKIAQGADLESAAVLLTAIAEFGDSARGFKVSGGVKEYQQAQAFYILTQLILDANDLNKKRFRIGASSLLDRIIS